MRTFVVTSVLALVCGLGGVGATQARANDCAPAQVVKTACVVRTGPRYRAHFRRAYRPFWGARGTRYYHRSFHHRFVRGHRR